MAIYTGYKPTNIALFAGAGGGELAAKHLLGWRTVCYVEHNPYAVDVLKSRMRDRYIDYAPVWDDCFTFDGNPWRGRVDIISAGFPCQPFSQAGRGLAERDPRNGWPATIRIIDEVRPRIAWLENVPGLISKFYIRRIFGELAEIGYDAEWGCLSAQAIGANHKRERLWILAYPHGSARTLSNISRKQEKKMESLWHGSSSRALADTNQAGRAEFKFSTQSAEQRLSDWENHALRGTNEWWKTESGLGRVANGVANRMDRLEAIGNGQVPGVAASAFRMLIDRVRTDKREIL